MSNEQPAVKPTGTRLPPDKRREQLVDIAIVLFGEPGADDVSLDDVAKAAGISRNLVYHYFPGKAALISAAARAEGDRLARMTNPDPALRGGERVAAALNAYFDFAEANPHGYRLIYRYAARNVETRQMLEANLDGYTERVLSWLPDPTPAAELAIRSWMAFLVFACLRWLDTPEVSRQEVMNLCGQTLMAALTSTGQKLP